MSKILLRLTASVCPRHRFYQHLYSAAARTETQSLRLAPIYSLLLQIPPPGLAIYREQGRNWFWPSFEAALADAGARVGETDAGLQRLGDALAEAERTESRWYEAEMHRIRAQILLKRDPADTAAAEQSLRTAIAIAQPQKARSLELRAALALAKLYRAANRDADAYVVLAPAVECFPPTRQFPELAEAQTIMSEDRWPP